MPEDANKKAKRMIKGVQTGAIACIGCKTYFFCSLKASKKLYNFENFENELYCVATVRIKNEIIISTTHHR